jgi:tetratricopeptide (TPR) repeat protein
MNVTAEGLASGILTAYSMFEQGRYKETIVLADGLLTLDTNNPYLRSLLASAYFKQNRLEEAVQEYNRAIELYPDDIASLVNRGEIYLRLGKFWEAAQDLKRASDLDPERKNAIANRARLLMQMTSGALKLADDKGIEALHNAQRTVEASLRSS